MFELIPGLEVLDNCDQDGNQIADDEEVIIIDKRTAMRKMRKMKMMRTMNLKVVFMHSRQ
jgi:hypothetical protein